MKCECMTHMEKFILDKGLQEYASRTLKDRDNIAHEMNKIASEMGTKVDLKGVHETLDELYNKIKQVQNSLVNMPVCKE